MNTLLPERPVDTPLGRCDRGVHAIEPSPAGGPSPGALSPVLAERTGHLAVPSGGVRLK